MSTSNLIALLDAPTGLPTTTPDGYREQLKAINFLSYSTRLTLHSCPRKFLLDKVTAKPEEADDNPDFLFGHSVAAGIQSFIAYGDKERALLDAFLAWNGSLDTEKEKSKKSIWFALLAVTKFMAMKSALLAGWEIAIIDGKPAVELSFIIDLENGHHYLGHIDLILIHSITKQFMVLELKTTSFNTINEATYKNSDQVTGYSVVLDSLAARLAVDSKNFTVLYLVYKSSTQEFEPLVFMKSRLERAAWLHDVLVDCTVADMYKQQEHFPMRGESCFGFFRPCEYFGICNLRNLTAKVKELVPAAGNNIAGVDYYFKLAEIVKSEMN